MRDEVYQKRGESSEERRGRGGGQARRKEVEQINDAEQ